MSPYEITAKNIYAIIQIWCEKPSYAETIYYFILYKHMIVDNLIQ